MRRRLTALTVGLACLACVACPAGAAAAVAAGAPATIFDPDTHSQGVYFEGTDGSLREMAWTAASGWSPVYVILPAGSLGSAPATVYDPDYHSQGVYFEGPDGSLREIYWTPSAGWSSVSTVASAGSLGSAPAANFDPEYHSQNVYYAGGDGVLRELSWTPASGWSQPSVLTPGGGVIAPAPTPPAPTPPASTSPASVSGPTGTGSVTLTPPHRKHRLAVKIVMKWHWNRRHTRLLWIKIGRTPGRAVFTITCRGRGCPAHRLRATAATLRRHHRTMRGQLYRAGDLLLVSLTAPSWKAERARITVRDGRKPAVHLP